MILSKRFWQLLGDRNTRHPDSHCQMHRDCELLPETMESAICACGRPRHSRPVELVVLIDIGKQPNIPKNDRAELRHGEEALGLLAVNEPILVRIGLVEILQVCLPFLGRDLPERVARLLQRRLPTVHRRRWLRLGRLLQLTLLLLLLLLLLLMCQLLLLLCHLHLHLLLLVRLLLLLNVCRLRCRTLRLARIVLHSRAMKQWEWHI